MRIAITGAASGIGRACALEYVRRGWEVIAIDRNPTDLPGVTSIVADLADPAAIAGLSLGPLDVLLSNAGVAVVKPHALTTDDDWRWLLDVNVLAPIRLVRAVRVKSGGQIAFVASLAGLFGAPGMVAYSTSKFALVGFAEAVRPELAAHRIGVTVICPGYVKTGLHGATRYANPAFERILDDPPRWYGMRADRVARRIAGAISAREAELVLGPEKLAWYVKRLSPALGRTLTRVAGKLTGVLP